LQAAYIDGKVSHTLQRGGISIWEKYKLAKKPVKIGFLRLSYCKIQFLDTLCLVFEACIGLVYLVGQQVGKAFFFSDKPSFTVFNEYLGRARAAVVVAGHGKAISASIGYAYDVAFMYGI
jgi:hypothetical protein